MNGIHGADIAELRTLAKRFDQCAQRLDADRMSVGHTLQTTVWLGPVAVRFKAQWDSQYSRQVHDAAQRLRGAAQELSRNADEQDKASAANGCDAAGVVGDIARAIDGAIYGVGAAVGDALGDLMDPAQDPRVIEDKHALDMLKFAKDPSHDPPAGYRRASPDELKALGIKDWMISGNIGLYVGIFKGPGDKYVVAFAGSSTDWSNPLGMAADWVMNDLPGAFSANPQERQALAIAASLKQHGVEVEYTGHSLGGQLAAVAAMSTGSRAVTFGAASVSRPLLALLGGRDRSEELITNYRMANDALAVAEDGVSSAPILPGIFSAVDRAAGTQVVLKDTGDWSPAGMADAHGNLDHVDKALHDRLRDHEVEAYKTPHPAVLPLESVKF